jgi:hypothetical protein
MATVEQTMMKVQRLLTGPMGLRITLAPNDSFWVTFSDSSASLQVRVRDGGKDREGEQRTMVLISSLIIRDVKPTPALFEWVARNGGSKWFGHIEVYDDKEPGTVYLLMSHTLLGDYLDQKELEGGMWTVLNAADAWDDELQKQFGGKRSSDT